MTFLSDFIIAILIAVIHLLISFKLKLSNTFKNKFRMYAVVVNLSFLVFLGVFNSFLSSWLFSDQGVTIYFNILFAFYFLLFVPLALALGFRFYTLVVHADIYSTVLKYFMIMAVSILLVGLVWVGIYPFIFTFYGFAP